MNSNLKTTLMVLLLCLVNTLFATVLVSHAANTTTTTEIHLDNFSVKDYQKMMGKKLTLSDKIIFRFAKNDLLKQSKTTNKTALAKAVADTGSGFNLGGFLLGFFLSIVGVLIALLFGKAVLRWAWKGFLAGLVLSVVAYFVYKDKA